MQYYTVTTEEQVSLPDGKQLIHNRTEVMLAKDGDAILKDCLARFGEHLLSMEANPISEKKIKPDTVIYVVI